MLQQKGEKIKEKVSRNIKEKCSSLSVTVALVVLRAKLF